MKEQSKEEFFLCLKEQGCNIEKALERFFYDKELYIQCYSKLIKSEDFLQLQESVKKENKETSLKLTHALKGVLANLELVSMHSVVLEIESDIKKDSWQEGYLKCMELAKIKAFYSNILQESEGKK